MTGHFCSNLFQATLSLVVMYNVAEWFRCVRSPGRGGAGQRCFVCHASRHATRHASTCATIVSWVLLGDSDRRVWACLYLARVLFSRLAGGYSRWVSDLLSFESETCRASVVWETRGWHEWRILLRQRENYWGSRTVGASCGVTVRDSPW